LDDHLNSIVDNNLMRWAPWGPLFIRRSQRNSWVETDAVRAFGLPKKVASII